MNFLTKKLIKEEYFPITKQELSLVKNNCFHPETDSCDGCENASDGDLPCTWEGANILEEKILFRPTVKDEVNLILDDLENKFREANQKGDFRLWNIGHIEEIIRDYRSKLV